MGTGNKGGNVGANKEPSGGIATVRDITDVSEAAFVLIFGEEIAIIGLLDWLLVGVPGEDSDTGVKLKKRFPSSVRFSDVLASWVGRGDRGGETFTGVLGGDVNVSLKVTLLVSLLLRAA